MNVFDTKNLKYNLKSNITYLLCIKILSKDVIFDNIGEIHKTLKLKLLMSTLLDYRWKQTMEFSHLEYCIISYNYFIQKNLKTCIFMK